MMEPCGKDECVASGNYCPAFTFDKLPRVCKVYLTTKKDAVAESPAAMPGLCVAECVDCGDQYCNVEGWKEDDWSNKRCPDCDGHLQARLFKPYPI